MAIVKKWSQFTNRANLSDNDNAQVMLLDTTVVSPANQNQRTPVTQILRSAKNLSDVDDAPTALNHLGVDVGNGKLAVGTADGEIVGFEGLTYDVGTQRLIAYKLRINEFVPTAGVVHNDTSGNITSSLIVSSDVDINFLSGVNHGDFSTDVVINFPNPTGMSVTAGNPSVPQKLQLTPADATNPGVVTAGTQTIGGDKTFTGTITALNLSNTNTGNVSLLSFGVTPNPAGLSLIGQQLNLEAADATNPGGVSTGTQTFAGDKTFSGTISASNLSNTNTGNVSLLSFGVTPNPAGLSLIGQQLNLEAADATNPGGVSTGTQTFAGNKTFSGTISASNLSNTNTGNVSLSSFGVTPNPAGLSLIGQQLNLEAADATNPGGVSTGTQTFAGNKTFLNGIIPQLGTTTQKNAISSPSQFQLFGDTTLGKLCVYISAAWQTITSV